MKCTIWNLKDETSLLDVQRQVGHRNPRMAKGGEARSRVPEIQRRVGINS